jgi:hypothetical protein
VGSTDEVVTGSLIEDAGGRWYRIDHVERMEPFLVSVVSDGDLWMFASSASTLTAGRVDADGALLPYETDDRLHRAVGVSGPVSLVAREVDGRREVWQPYAPRPAPGCHRSLAKHVLGNALRLEEVNPAWGLLHRTTWTPSRSYGWVRTVELVDRSGEGARVEVLDGLLDVMPAGVDAAIEQRTSNLVDAYKRSETGPWGTAAVYALESLITDRAEPAETLAATLVWSAGLTGAEVHLDEGVVDDVWAGRPRRPTDLLTGRRGAYLLRHEVTLPPSGVVTWVVVADTGLGHAELHDRVRAAGEPDVRERVAEDVHRGSQRLEERLADADGHQRTADPITDVHHLSNVLFNCMRGGTFPAGYQLGVADLLAFLRTRNLEVHERHAAALGALGVSIHREELLGYAGSSGDDDLLRLALEYLPLTFSRRHGDPSRPWNRFAIRVTAEDGSELLNHEGNWRDIFQNWEALLRSYPRYHLGVVATFLNASTADGHNPYRISRDGIDWEVPDPEDPWSNIGYWGDHQIVYLLRLLEGWEATEPEAIGGWLDRPVFTYADVPYRIAGHAAMLADPRSTISFDRQQAAAVAARVERLGADGRLLVAGDDLVRVTMAEKLLVPALAKLSSYVAGGGIWMNTQRPEWNDANNALAGYGLSMVTLYQLERYLDHLHRTLVVARERPVTLSVQVATWLRSVTQVLSEHDAATAVADDGARRRLLDALGGVAETYRREFAAGFDPATSEVDVDGVGRLLTAALEHLRATIGSARRADGLYHSYDLVSFPGPDRATVHHLAPMLEGQVAVLGTSTLGHDEAAALVDALFDSPLYRPDQDTFLLYPAAARPSFLERNLVPPELVEQHPVLADLVGPDHGRVLERDRDGGLHFRAGLANAEALTDALEATSLDEAGRATVLAVYEQLFHHHAFTGRSGGMHGYEGIGSVYWHMVAKLLLAVQERCVALEGPGGDEVVRRRLVALYRRVRDGLGFRKDPAAHGAVPTDCYSHTPAHAGAQQPGMTGQVKEEILTRAGELGFRIADGTLSLGEPLLPTSELGTDLGDGSVGYEATVCAVPVRVLLGAQDQVRVVGRDGTVRSAPGRSLTRDESAALFDRAGDLSRVEFTVSVADPAPTATGVQA